MKAILQPWLDLSRDEEVLAVLDLVGEALKRRCHLVALAMRKISSSEGGGT